MIHYGVTALYALAIRSIMSSNIIDNSQYISFFRCSPKKVIKRRQVRKTNLPCLSFNLLTHLNVITHAPWLIKHLNTYTDYNGQHFLSIIYIKNYLKNISVLILERMYLNSVLFSI